MTTSSELEIVDAEKDDLALRNTVKDKAKIAELEDKVLALENALKEREVLASKKEKEVLALKNALKKAGDCMDCKAARKRLIEYWAYSNGIIGLKRMGEINVTRFNKAVKKRLHWSNLEVRTKEMWSFWQNKISDRSWYPFKMVPQGSIHDCQMIVDGEDGYLKMLRIHLGDEACELVISALKEMIEYSLINRSLVPELWNFAADRKATLKEAIDVIYNGDILGQRKRFRAGVYYSH